MAVGLFRPWSCPSRLLTTHVIVLHKTCSLEMSTDRCWSVTAESEEDQLGSTLHFSVRVSFPTSVDTPLAQIRATKCKSAWYLPRIIDTRVAWRYSWSDLPLINQQIHWNACKLHSVCTLRFRPYQGLASQRWHATARLQYNITTCLRNDLASNALFFTLWIGPPSILRRALPKMVGTVRNNACYECEHESEVDSIELFVWLWSNLVYWLQYTSIQFSLIIWSVRTMD